MQIASTTRDGITFVTPTGLIDTRTAQAFEATMVQAYGGGARSFAIDFGRVDLITSAGIRVLVMMAHRLQRGAGGLVLFALGDRVRTVFEIGGLLQQFRIVASEQDAVAALSKPREARAPEQARASRLASLIFDVVCPEALQQSLGRAGSASPGAPSALTAAVVDALGRWSPARDTSPADSGTT
jgi:stage II sporulation protein AA (anti-sigma F factor antagonist)